MGITRDEALDCLRSDDLVGIGMEADAVRRRLHPEGVVTYAIGASINLSSASRSESPLQHVVEQLRRPVEAGATCARVRALSHVAELATVLEIVRNLRSHFPSLWLEASVGDIHLLTRTCGCGNDSSALISQLHEAGLDGIGPQDATTADRTSSSADWLPIYRAAHTAGMPVIASVSIGVDTSAEQRVDQLARLYELQAETSVCAALAVVVAPPAGGRELDGVTAVERLKMLATARMFLDNIVHVQGMPSAHGLKVLQTSLRFGANDVGWVLPIAGPSDSSSDAPEEDIRRIIRGAGFDPAERDPQFRSMTTV